MKRGNAVRESGQGRRLSDKADSDHRFGAGLQRGGNKFNARGNDDTFERLRDLDVDSFHTQESDLSRDVAGE